MLLKLFTTVVDPDEPLEPAILLTSVTKPPALYPGLFGIVGVEPALLVVSL